MRVSRVALMLAVAAVAWGAGERSALADLDATQQASLSRAESLIKSAEGDLNAAAGSAGTAANPAKGSRLKLTKMRLDSGIQRLNEAAATLSGLPGNDAAVAALLARHAAAAANAQKIQAILTAGSPQPAGEGSGRPPNEGTGMRPPPAGNAGPKLDYKQEKSLKDARWYLREVDKYSAGAMEVVKRLDGEGEPAVHSDVRAGLGYLEQAAAKFELVRKYLAELPGDHPDVKAAVDRANAQLSTLGALDSRLRAVDTELEKLTGMRHYPHFEEDLERIQDFGRRYGDFQMTAQQPETLASIVREDPEVMSELKRVARAYLPLVEQKTEAGARLDKLIGWFMQKRDGFATELKTYRDQLPAAIDKDLAEANRFADMGVAQKNPRYFGEDSGIEQQLGFAEGKIGVLEVLDAAKGAEYRKRITDARAKIAERAESLREEIIKTNKLPPNLYQQADRADLIKRATAGWHAVQAGAKVLGARIPSAEWRRVTEWRWSRDHFYKVDYSRLQVQLLIEHDSNLAAVRAVNLMKNHLEGDRITVSPMDGADDPLRPQQLLMKDKIR